MGSKKPKVLFISQAPSLQAWINGYQNTAEDGGLVSTQNEFFVNNILEVFGLGEKDIDLFRNNVFWVHSCNCYPWFRWQKKKDSKGREKSIRQDNRPTKGQVKNCLGKWLKDIIQLKDLKAVVLMGEPATYLFEEKLNPKKIGFTELVKKEEIRTDIIKGLEFLPIFHQSDKSRVFNSDSNQQANNRIKILLTSKFKEWIN